MYRILLVEDDKSIRELICNYFTKKEKDVFKIEIAADGQTGWEKAYENNYDLLLLDVMLPEMDGFMICKEIRKKAMFRLCSLPQERTKLIFLTAMRSAAMIM